MGIFQVKRLEYLGTNCLFFFDPEYKKIVEIMYAAIRYIPAPYNVELKVLS